MNRQVNQPTTIDRELMLDYFLTISRAEFALKTAGFVRRSDGDVRPDWSRFATTLAPTLDTQGRPELEDAVNYYLGVPPQKQVVRNNEITWENSAPNQATEVANLLVLVRRVRNNLFHGGKYNQQFAPETERNEQLLRYGIAIVTEALRQNPDVWARYEEAAI